jgi:hypothetical protein
MKGVPNRLAISGFNTSLNVTPLEPKTGVMQQSDVLLR